MQRYRCLFEDGGRLDMDPDQITKISHDLGSWVAFMRMLLGGPPAQMKARLKDGTDNKFVVGRREQFGDNDSYAKHAT